MLRWDDIDTVLLDMDGTILDLHFDTRFWLHHLPRVFAQHEGLHHEHGRELLKTKLHAVEGTLQWYCLDYWQDQLGLDLVSLKQELAHLIRYREGARDFLLQLRASGRRVVLVTNAHSHSLALKMVHTDLGELLDATVTSHAFGHPKESAHFWPLFHADHPFEPQRTLFVDDSLPVLRAAQGFGVAHLLAVARPDSKGARRDTGEFIALDKFTDITSTLQSRR